MTDRRGFLGRLLAAPLAAMGLKGAGGGGMGRFAAAISAPLRHGIPRGVFAEMEALAALAPPEVDPDIEPIPDTELTVGPARRIFQAEEAIGFTDDVVPGGYVKGADSEAKMTSFDPEAVDRALVEVYENVERPGRTAIVHRGPWKIVEKPPLPPPRFAGPWAESFAYIADSYGTRHALLPQ